MMMIIKIKVIIVIIITRLCVWLEELSDESDNINNNNRS
jgi:hypothetical protein